MRSPAGPSRRRPDRAVSANPPAPARPADPRATRDSQGRPSTSAASTICSSWPADDSEGPSTSASSAASRIASSLPRRRVGLEPRLPQLPQGAVPITGQQQTDASRQTGRRATRLLDAARQLPQLAGQPETSTLRSDLVQVRRRRCRQPLRRRSALEGASSPEVQIVEQGRGQPEAVDRRVDPARAQHPPGVGHDQTGVVVSQPGNATYPVGLVGGGCRRGLLQEAGDGAPVLGTGMGPEGRAR